MTTHNERIKAIAAEEFNAVKDAVLRDINSTTLTVRELAEKHSVAQRRIIMLAKERGINLDQRRRDISRRNRKSVAQAKYKALAPKIKADLLSMEMDIRGIAKKWGTTRLAVTEAAKILGIDTAQRARKRIRHQAQLRGKPMTNGQRADLRMSASSADLLAMSWTSNPPTGWNYWGCGV